MSCTICGKRTGPGALLCRPCKAALKRARQFSVLEIPGTAPAVTMPGLAQERQAVRARVRARARKLVPRPIVGPRSLLAIGVIVIALAISWYLTQRLARADEPQTEFPSRPSVSAANRAPPALPADTGNPERFSEIAPPAAPARPKPVHKAAVKTSVPDLRAEAALPEPSPVVTAAAPELPRQAAVAVAAPPPDRWQVMGDALARCASEGGISGFICDQRVRLSSCDGYWGRVPQCPHPSNHPR